MRLFLAVDLPDSLRRGLGELQRRLRSDLTGWRWVRPEGIHLTMRFLGEVAEEEDARQRTAWRLAAGACPRVRFRVGGTGVFPPRGAPRVLWAGVRALDPMLLQNFENAGVKLLEPSRAELDALAKATRPTHDAFAKTSGKAGRRLLAKLQGG